MQQGRRCWSVPSPRQQCWGCGSCVLSLLGSDLLLQQGAEPSPTILHSLFPNSAFTLQLHSASDFPTPHCCWAPGTLHLTQRGFSVPLSDVCG